MELPRKSAKSNRCAKVRSGCAVLISGPFARFAKMAPSHYQDQPPQRPDHALDAKFVARGIAAGQLYMLISTFFSVRISSRQRPVPSATQLNASSAIDTGRPVA